MPSFTKNGETWMFVLDIGLDAKTGKRKQIRRRGFRTKKEAQNACAEAQLELEQGTLKPRSKLTVEAFLNEWITTKRLSLKSSTWESYERLVKQYLIAALGKRPLADLTGKDIETLYASLTDKLSPNTIRDVHKVLNAALNHAIKKDMITKNPAVNVEKPRQTKKELSVWDEEQAKQFLDAAKENRAYIAFALALKTGMRQGEILGLRWIDIDFERQQIRVVQTLSHNGKELSIGAKTQSGNRVIAIDESLAQELMEQRKKVPQYELVIPTSTGKPLTPRNLTRAFDTIKSKTELPNITFHDLRHTHATLLLRKNVNPKIVAERLGHADMRTTLEIYSHVLPDMQKEAANAVKNLFS